MLGLMLELVSSFLEYHSSISNKEFISINTNNVQLFEDNYVFLSKVFPIHIAQVQTCEYPR